MKIALVSARAARGLDEDELPLRSAFEAAGHEATRAEWDDVHADWASFDVVLPRSAWDYAERLDEFLAWAQRVSTLTTLLNPLPVIRWNTDKHYLAQLASAGVATVPSTFVEPGDDACRAVERFAAEHASEDIVVKPAVGAGSRDTERHRRTPRLTCSEEPSSATAHASRLLAANRSVLLQPYLTRVDQDGETALMFFEGRFSHAIRKGPLLPPRGAATTGLFATEQITPRIPGADELSLAARAIAAIPFETPLYARVDLIRDDSGAPCLLELELTEPSLFFAHAPGSAGRCVAAVLRRRGLQRG